MLINKRSYLILFHIKVISPEEKHTCTQHSMAWRVNSKIMEGVGTFTSISRANDYSVPQGCSASVPNWSLICSDLLSPQYFLLSIFSCQNQWPGPICKCQKCHSHRWFLQVTASYLSLYDITSRYQKRNSLIENFCKHTYLYLGAPRAVWCAGPVYDIFKCLKEESTYYYS